MMHLESALIEQLNGFKRDINFIKQAGGLRCEHADRVPDPVGCPNCRANRMQCAFDKMISESSGSMAAR